MLGLIGTHTGAEILRNQGIEMEANLTVELFGKLLSSEQLFQHVPELVDPDHEIPLSTLDQPNAYEVPFLPFWDGPPLSKDEPGMGKVRRNNARAEIRCRGDRPRRFTPIR